MMNERRLVSDDDYRFLFEHSLDAILLTVPDGTILAANPAACRMFQRSEEEICALGRQGLVDGNDPRLEQALEHRARTGRLQSELNLVRKDGTIFPAELTSSVFRDKEGNVRTSMIIRDVSERKRAEQQLHYLGLLLKNVNDAIVAADAQHRLTMWNAEAEKMYGWRADEALGRNGLELLQTEFPDPDKARVLAEIDARGYYRGEVTQIRQDGTRIPVEISSIVMYDERGKVNGYLSVNRDISERKRAEQQLRESEERYRLFAENARDLIYRYRFVPTRGFEYVSPSAIQLTGYTPEEHYADPDLGFKLVHPDDRVLLQNVTDGAVVSEEPLILRWIKKDGSIVWTEQHNVPIYDAQGQLIAIEGIARDVTERKRAEDALRKLEQVVEQSPVSIVITDLGAKIQYVNSKFAEVSGYAREEVIGKNPRLLQSGQTPRETYTALWAALTRGEMWRGEFLNKKKNGELYWEFAIISPLVNARGKIEGYVGIKQDVTTTKRAEQQLRESEERYRDLFENNPNPMWIYDTETLAILAVNEMAIQHYGYSQEEFLSMTLADIRPAEDVPKLYDNVRTHQEALQQSNHWRHRKKNGALIEVEIASHALPERLGPNLRLVVVNDVTARKRAEQDLRQRLAELEVIHRVSMALRAAQSFDEMLPLLMDELLAVMETSVGAIWLHDAEAGQLRGAVMRGWFEQFKELGIKPGEGITGAVFATGETRMIPDFASNELLLPSIRAQVPPGWNGIAVPLKTATETVGVMYAAVAQPREISLEQATLLTSLAEIAGTALHRLRLHEETRRRVERLQTLQTVDRAITTSFDSKLTIGILLEQTTSQLGVDAAGILLYNPHALSLEFAAGHGFQTRAYEHSTLRVGEGFAGRAALERRMIHIPNVTEELKLARPELWAKEGFVAYAAAPLLAKGELKGVLEIFCRRATPRDSEWFEFLETLAHQAAIAIDNAQLFEGLQRTNLELALAYDETIEGWSRALDLRDQETEGHSRRVTEMTLALARRLGIGEKELVHVRRGALLHDIGKMGVPDSILRKPGPLTDDEWRIMQMHPQLAFDLLYPIAFLRPALDIPLCHHEKWDGTGYPRGFAGNEIPLPARIFALVDVWDALHSDRPYRARWEKEQVRAYMRAQAGKHFDPQLVEPFLELVETEFR